MNERRKRVIGNMSIVSPSQPTLSQRSPSQRSPSQRPVRVDVPSKSEPVDDKAKREDHDEAVGMSVESMSRTLEELHDKSFVWALVCCRGDREQAEEVLQTVYLKVLDGRASYAGSGTFKTWLFAVIRRTAAGMWRRKAIYVRALETLRGFGDPSRSPEDPEHELGRSETKQHLAAALSVLSARQRQILELVFYQDLSIREAAEVLGLTLGTARAHYERGKKRLAREIEALENGYEK